MSIERAQSSLATCWLSGIVELEFIAVISAAVMLAGCGEAEFDPAEALSSSDRALAAQGLLPKLPHKAVCDYDPRPGMMHCHARVRTDNNGIVPFAAGPTGLKPADLRAAYNIPASGGSGKTVAIVDAYDDPNAEKDLGTYRSQFGLVPCTTANGCFKKVNQSGKTSPLPRTDTGWAGEIALDIQMVSATCPDCKILLVEANSSSDTDLMAAEATAVQLGAAAISNSWGGGESSAIASKDATWFNHPGVAITVSSGDSGYGIEYPASSKYVISVGGTSLVKSGGTRGWSETVWGSTSSTNGGAGSGCSAYISKPTWQKDTGCARRTAADVAAIADPNTGVSVYDSFGGSGWAVYGGTSASAPIVAGILAVTGNSATDASLAYSKPSAFFDVTAGQNGSCGGSYLCTAKAGYDGPTGYGTPNGAMLTGGGTCTPSCTGKVCGGDGCGGSCGTCASGMMCDGSGQCTGASTCAHPICRSGPKLTASCDPCAAKICAADSYCCSTSWDSICVGEVRSICGTTC